MIEPRGLLAQFDSLGVTPTGVADDSRQVRPGDLFVAYPGAVADGRAFVADAVGRGAVGVLWQPGEGFAWNDAWAVPHLAAEDLRSIVGPLANLVYGHPSEGLSLIAVTGTNGKTSITQWIARVHPKTCTVIGTLGAGFPGQLAATGFTTPEATTLMRLLADFRAAGAQACALEASSIGIAEGRMSGAHVDVAILTNLTRDHLDYHGDMETYAAAKEQLFVWPRLRLAVVNLDDPFGVRLARETTALRVLGYTIGDDHHDVPAVVRAENLKTTGDGQEFVLSAPNGRAEVATRLLGRFNISNLLAVACVLVDCGMAIREIAHRLSTLSAPPGRLERLEGDPLVVVDYAHTPDALENVLSTLGETAKARGGKLVAVFGCGGDRDPGKRAPMGAIAARLADRVILTNDNPRSEDPRTILAAIQAGAPLAAVIADRGAAIRQAVLNADDADVVVLAGKGHEPYQEIKGVRSHFSDLEQADAALLARRRQGRAEFGLQWSLSDIARAVGGRLVGMDCVINGVSTDTRKINAGQLFIALRGERFDAHDFLVDALQGGASALLVSRADKLPAETPAIVVADTRLALGQMAAAWRRSFDLPVIAVTGSNGKTTTKEMIASILQTAFGDAVLATRGNFNNDIGLPLTLLGLDATHRAGVIEMGMNRPGEIAYLAGIGAPTAAVVTNAQRAHLQGMGDLDAVAAEKGSIYSGLQASGVAVVNADDRYAETWKVMAAPHRIVTFGLDQPADVRGTVVTHGLDQALSLSYGQAQAEIHLRVPGRHNARNALAAAATCLAAGLPLAAVVQGLAAFSGVKGRLQRRPGLNGAVLLDDTYNANPDSVRAGIKVLAATVGKKILVLGDMGEIGEASAQYHDEVGGFAKCQGVDQLFALGEASVVAVRNFGEGGRHFRSVEALLEALRPQLDAATTVLVKGSRFMKMERVADAVSTDSSNNNKEAH